jgi:serine phosphatase RsbU (regulator of sigma subunit)
VDTVKDVLLTTTGQSAQEICLTLVGKVEEFMGKKPAQNDVTTIALARSAAGKSFAAAG